MFQIYQITLYRHKMYQIIQLFSHHKMEYHPHYRVLQETRVPMKHVQLSKLQMTAQQKYFQFYKALKF